MNRIRLVIASTSDVSPERDAVVQVGEELNKLLGRPNDFMIEVWRWETDSGPGFHPLGPQGSIDDNLRIADCDILIAIFWTRFGTKILRRRETGTEHEINLAFEAWNKTKKKPQILIYFKAGHVDPSTIDTEQLAKVNAFRKEFNPKGKYRAGLYDTFVTLEGFKDKLRLQLAKHLPTASHGGLAAANGFDFDGYRTRFGYAPKWDLSNIGVPQAPGDAPVAPTLEEIYQELRIADQLEPQKFDLGAPLLPDEVAVLDKRIIVLGPAGAGKTTWIRHIFFQLLQSPGVCPFLVELRKVAGTFERLKAQGNASSLISYLAATLHEMDCGAQGLEEALSGQAGPRPILLVDGWDELGELGREFRQKLTGFLRSHPRVGAVVTSRPYGIEKPDANDGFIARYVQPLNDGEIGLFSSRFWEVCYANDPKRGEFAGQFQAALQFSPSAKALARTPLLCTMMLFISRSRTLPDERHELYQICVDHSLGAYRREELKVPGMPHHWRPEKLNERLRAVASLAYAIHRKIETRSHTIVLSSREMALLLPESCDGHREAFLAWLAGPAGLLNDRSDGSLAFSHLSFQEYLAAWHIANVLREEDQSFENWARKTEYSEVLRLWGAIAWSGRRERFAQVAQKLSCSDHGISALGGMLADGWGTEALFEGWVEQVLGVLVQRFPAPFFECAKAWSGSHQHRRRQEFQHRFGLAVAQWNWVSYFRADRWSRLSSFDLPTAPSPTASILSTLWPFESRRKGNAGIPGILIAAQYPTTAEMQCALGRVWVSAIPARSSQPWQMGLCEVWPSARRILGIRLQVLLSLLGARGWTKRTAEQLMPLRRNSETKGREESIARAWLGSLDQFLQEYVDDCPEAFSDAAKEWARYQVSYSLGDSPADRDWFRGYRAFGGNEGGVWLRTAIFHYGSPPSLRRLLEAFDSIADGGAPRASGAKGSENSDYSLINGLVSGCGAARSQIAWSCPWKEEPATLISVACRESLHPGQYSKDLADALVSYSGDPLWPALARHLARQSSSADRNLLTDLAQHPEKREPPLRWGLKYIVRGDVMLPNFSARSQDRFLGQFKLPALSYLEDLPEEINLPKRKRVSKRGLPRPGEPARA